MKLLVFLGLKSHSNKCGQTTASGQRGRGARALLRVVVEVCFGFGLGLVWFLVERRV